MMEIVRQLIRRKPHFFLITALVYLLIVGILKWHVSFVWDSVWYFLGGLVGVYFLDASELFFAVSPSPFRSIFFLALYSIVSFFVVSSSANGFAAGLVLSVYVQLLLWQLGEWKINGNLDSWYRTASGTVPRVTQRVILWAFCAVIVLQTFFFIRA